MTQEIKELTITRENTFNDQLKNLTTSGYTITSVVVTEYGGYSIIGFLTLEPKKATIITQK